MSKHSQFLGSLVLIIFLGAVIIRGSLIDPVGLRLRILLGSLTLLFLPGRWITTAAFDEKEIDDLERIALSFTFSISVVPLLVFYANLAGVKITERLVLGCIVLIVVICKLFIEYKKSHD